MFPPSKGYCFIIIELCLTKHLWHCSQCSHAGMLAVTTSNTVVIPYPTVQKHDKRIALNQHMASQMSQSEPGTLCYEASTSVGSESASIAKDWHSHSQVLPQLLRGPFPQHCRLIRQVRGCRGRSSDRLPRLRLRQLYFITTGWQQSAGHNFTLFPPLTLTRSDAPRVVTSTMSLNISSSRWTTLLRLRV